jgi:hypothetical protein
VKREVHQKEGVPVKRHRVLYDGKAQEETDFTMDVADSLGSFATANQFLVGNLKGKIEAEGSVGEPIGRPNKYCRARGQE